MAGYNPERHHRRSIRMKGYDYSQKGFYFITICTQHRVHFFGKVENKTMILNDAGKMVEKWYYELENKFPDIKCHAMVIMPNHLHCIIENIGIENVVSVSVVADLRVRPELSDENNSNWDKSDLRGEHDLGDNDNNSNWDEPNLNWGEHKGSPLHRVMQWFKTMATNEYIRGVKNLGWQRFDKKLFQRDYWEHIIRNESSYHRITKYINDNPKNWNDDKLK